MSIALIAGFAVGALTFGTFGNSPRQTSATSVTPNAPTGVTFPLVEATMVTASSSPATGDCASSNLGTAGAPTALASGTNTTICLSTAAGGYALGDLTYILDVEWDTTADAATTFEVQVFFAVTPTANDVVQTAYVQTSGTITSPEVGVFALDLTQSGDNSVTGFTVIVTEL
ncbi:MAG TPA: hypothetical protein VMH49_00735 [Thermoplasmata archaeon]|nr:hypothetical protein [Thermoplasmata archaeon]